MMLILFFFICCPLVLLISIVILVFSRLFGSVAKSCMQKQPQSGGQREEGAPHEMT